MEQNQIAIIKKEMQVQGTKVIATSKAVAFQFGKSHKNVLRDVETLEIPEEFNRLNFEPVKYLDAKGESRKMYSMTRDGFVFLVMGYTGRKANEIKIAYIQAFNEMEAELKALRDGQSFAQPIPADSILVPKDRYISLLEDKIQILESTRRPCRRLSLQDKNKILSLAAAGKTAYQITRLTGLAKTTVQDFLAKNRKAVQ